MYVYVTTLIGDKPFTMDLMLLKLKLPITLKLLMIFL